LKKLSVIFCFYCLIGFAASPELWAAQNNLKGDSVRPAAKTLKLNPAFAITATALTRKLKSQPKILIVDVRLQTDFEKFHIPGSIHIPLFSIKSKTFLKSGPVVLVNQGCSYGQLEHACRNLNKAGFKAAYLYGGLNSWKRSGQTLKGDVFAQKRLNRITPAIFYNEKNYAHWIVLDVHASPDQIAASLFPDALSVPFTTDNKRFVAAFDKLASGHKANPLTSFIILNQNGTQYDAIEKVLRQSWYPHQIVFYLNGGIEGCQAFLNQQETRRQAKHNPEKFKKCSHCP
jgi:rhodanese-related sulfurtransferase